MLVDATGNIVIGGVFRSSIDLGGGRLRGAGGADIFVAKFDPAGNHLWSKRFGGAGDQSITGMALDSVGDIVIATLTDVDFGGGPTCIAKLDATGTHLWSMNASSSPVPVNVTYERGPVAVRSTGNIITTYTARSSFTAGSIDFGGGPDPLVAHGMGFYAVEYSPSGKFVAQSRIAEGGAPVSGACANARRIAVDASDNVVIAGRFISASLIPSPGPSMSFAHQAFIVKRGPGWEPIWQKPLSTNWGVEPGQPGCSPDMDIAVDSAGAVAAVGSFTGSMDLGGGPLTASSIFQADIFLAKFDAAGNHLHSHSYGDPIPPTGWPMNWTRSDRIALDAAGNIVFTGYSSTGPVSLSDGVEVSGPFVAKFDPGGNYLWHQSLVSSPWLPGLYQEVAFVGTDALGSITLAGSFQGSVNPGGGTLSSAGLSDVFLAKMVP
jgi:hypothetical protein